MQNQAHPHLDKLLSGIKNFQERFYALNPEVMKDLVNHGQKPRTLLISCSDSRVDPALLTDAAPGELFVVRNVANLVPPYDLEGKYDGARAAIEYAIRDLEVSHVVILGHAHCGGIKALLSTLAGQKPQRDFIGDWVSLGVDSCHRYIFEQSGTTQHISKDAAPREIDLERLREHQHLVERAAIRGSLDQLRNYPWISERLETGSLTLHGWWFDLETGDLWATDDDNTVFLPVID